MDYTLIIIAIFVIGYTLITIEHNIHINKTATALLTGVLCWTIYIMFDHHHGHTLINKHLSDDLSKIAEILFFLLGAMTIVELIDSYEGFRILTDRIKTRNQIKLLWVISILTFFLSAALDNLTTAIVMVSLLKKLVDDSEQRKLYAGVVIIAANAGGAWSPIGDVTTTMLWIGGQITALNIMEELFLPSLVSLIVPVLWISFFMKGDLKGEVKKEQIENPREAMIMFVMGIGALLFVPIFKTITHLPPYMGILFGLGVMWITSEILNGSKNDEIGRRHSVPHALSRIDTSSILFFLGILVAIGSLSATGVLTSFAKILDTYLGYTEIIMIFIGLASAVVDNVPLVAAAQGMYSLKDYGADHKLWELLAYCAGTGGSILIIGSAAGVAVMGMEKIDFFWYVKKVSLAALLGYFAGVAVYLVEFLFIAP
ncbi:MAG: sodium:proton antiporter [Bacteroidetes bacterium]|nr:MAG: sodium:proton antiporter [Bacteroidota bacterium]TAG93885.1 MAG: sodium:proton antiporter [Bacteroidota bacterium]